MSNYTSHIKLSTSILRSDLKSETYGKKQEQLNAFIYAFHFFRKFKIFKIIFVIVKILQTCSSLSIAFRGLYNFNVA